MGKSPHTAATPRRGAIDWADARSQRVEYTSRATIFVQGDPATNVLYIEDGTVRLSVLSHAGKEAVVAILGAGDFFGEGCVVGQTERMATATAMSRCAVISVEKPDMLRQLHTHLAFADRFLTHVLTRNIRTELSKQDGSAA